MEAKKNTMSILMLPWLAHGHISPFLELAKKLTKKNFHIYICSTPITLTSIKKTLTPDYTQSIELIDLHLPISSPPPHDHLDLPSIYHTTNGLPPHLMNTLKTLYEMSTPNFSKILQTLNPDLVIYDYNQTWAATCASSMNIPAVQFLTFSAAVIALGIHMFDKPCEKFPFQEIYLRGYELVQLKKAMEVSSSDGDDDRIKFPFDDALRMSQDIVLMKTSRDIDGRYMDYLQLLVSKKIVPVGSLVQDFITIGEDHEEIMQWLDKKEQGSTVFVSFGSEYFLSKEELHEIAKGLELSKMNFIWVIRFPKSENINIQHALPKGFLEKVGERGMILQGWAPQATILQHKSIGGFVSHCGWSSCMESMKFGVPIIAIPMQIDQPMNARLVEHVGIGIEALRDENGKLQSEEIGKVIRLVAIEESGEDMRNKAKELSEKMKMKMKGDEEINGVVEELLALCRNKI